MQLARAVACAACVLASSSNASATVTFQTFDVPAAVNLGAPDWHDVGDTFGANFFIRGDGTDIATGFGSSANPNGSLSYLFSTSTPGIGEFFSFLTGSATFNDFVISGDSVTLTDFDISTNVIHSNGTAAGQVDLKTLPHFLTYNADQTMDIGWRGLQDFGFGFTTEVQWEATGGYIRNDAGFDDATTTAFGASQPAAAAYLNQIVANHAPLDWTQAGIWLIDEDYTAQNTGGTLAANLIGGHFVGYNVWYSTDPFVFGNPLGDPTPEDPLSPDDLASLVTEMMFPDTVGLSLAGIDTVQIWDIDLSSGDGSPVEVIFEYDQSLLPPGFDETLLRIAHWNGTDWEFPAGQVVDTVNDTITLSTSDFSPFALTTVPIPAALYLFGAGIVALGFTRRKQ